MAKWQAALIGCGSIGSLHAQCVQQLDAIEMVAYCDVDAERAQKTLDTYGGRYATADVDQILADDAVQVVYICTQHDTHADFCIRAAQAGKHVLVEKPLALTVEACQAVGRAVADSGITLMTAFKMRYYDLVQKVHELIPQPSLVTMQMMDNRWPDDFWANDPIRGGGNVLSQGVHSCDLLRYLAGSDPVSVAAVGGNYYQKTGVIDNMAAVYTFKNGAVASLVQGDSHCPSLVSKFYLQAFAENQSATLSARFCKLVYQQAGQDPVQYVGSETGFLEENRAFVDALNRGLPAPVDHRDGLLATLMILQGVAARRSGQPQPVAALL